MTTKRTRQPFSRRGEQAIRAEQEAALTDAMPRTEVGDDIVYSAEARLARARAEQYLKSATGLAVSAGEAVTWENKADELFLGAHVRIMLKSGGTQRIIVQQQQVNVGPGGQALIAGQLAARGATPSAFERRCIPSCTGRDRSVNPQSFHRLGGEHSFRPEGM